MEKPMYVILVKRPIDRNLSPSAAASAAIYANFAGFQFILWMVLRVRRLSGRRHFRSVHAALEGI